MKRFGSLFMAFTLATGLLSTSALAQGTGQSVNVTIQFKDIASVPWAHDAIQRLTSEGVIAGMGNNLFAPNQGVTREQFARLLNTNYGLDTVIKPVKYMDVSTTRWSYTSVQNATPYMDYYKNLTGTGFLFRPEQQMQRQDVAVTLVKLMVKLGKLELPTAEQTDTILAPFKDANKIALTARPYLAEAVEEGLLYGYDPSTLAPTDRVTRAQAVVFLDRVDQHLLVVPDLPAEGDTIPTDSVEDHQQPSEEPTPAPTESPTPPPSNYQTPTYIDRVMVKPDVDAPEPLALTTKWNGYIGCTGSNVALAGPLAVAVSGCSDGAVYAYDLLTGKKAWEHDQNTYYQGTVAGSANTVLLTQGSGVLALSAGDGHPVWSQYFNAKVAQMKLENGQAFVITNNTLYVMDEMNGQALWARAFRSGLTGLEVRGDQVAVSTVDGHLYSFAFNGQALASTAVSTYAVTGLTSTDQEWIVTHGNRVSAVDRAGTVKWTRAFYNNITGGNVAVDGQTVYAVTNNRLVVSIDLPTGEVKGVQPLNFTIAYAPAAQDGKVYMTTNEGYLHVVDGASLQTINTTSSAGSVYMSRLYINGTPLLYSGYVVGLHHQPGYSGDTDIIAFH